MENDVSSLGEVFVRSAKRYPENPALYVDGVTYDYQEMLNRSLALAKVISQQDKGQKQLCAIFGRRSLYAYVGILGTLFSGRGYVPLNPTFPVERTQTMLGLSGASTLIVDGNHMDLLRDILVGHHKPLVVILAELTQLPEWVDECPQHSFISLSNLTISQHEEISVKPSADSIAYLLFTSGTTGTPKGIGIQQKNVLAYLDAMKTRYSISSQDRFSQNFELTFDLSVHDMFVCWGHGACLYVPSERMAMAPRKFIRDNQLTCWFSTPSTPSILSRLRMLTPGSYPSIRLSLFCGEPLSIQIADMWQQAAPNSIIENLYGPTEATIACTGYTFLSPSSRADCENDLVPIGKGFGCTQVLVVNETGKAVSEGKVGELLLGGDQIAPGYWEDSDRTAKSFLSLPSGKSEERWYRTGDLVAQNANGDLVYHGRVDDQIKITGHRVELQEIEAVGREATGSETVIALGWPRTSAGADGVILFTLETKMPDVEVLGLCRSRLPAYMVPTEIHRVKVMPLNSNGKVDRRALFKWREEMCVKEMAG